MSLRNRTRVFSLLLAALLLSGCGAEQENTQAEAQPAAEEELIQEALEYDVIISEFILLSHISTFMEFTKLKYYWLISFPSFILVTIVKYIYC